MPPRRRPRRRPLAALSAVAVLAGCAGSGGEAFQSTHNGALPLEADRSVGQTFRPASDVVAGVDLLVATYGEQPDPQGRLSATLTDHADGRRLASASVPGAQLDDNAWVRLRFDAPAPAPQVAAIVVTWSGQRPVALRANTPPAELGEDRPLNDPYPGGELLRDGEPGTGDLAFRVVGAGGVRVAAATYVRLARGFLVGLLADPGFAVVWLALLVGALVLASTGFRRARDPGL